MGVCKRFTLTCGHDSRGLVASDILRAVRLGMHGARSVARVASLRGLSRKRGALTCRSDHLGNTSHSALGAIRSLILVRMVQPGTQLGELLVSWTLRAENPREVLFPLTSIGGDSRFRPSVLNIRATVLSQGTIMNSTSTSILAFASTAFSVTAANATFSATYLGIGAFETHQAAFSSSLAWDSVASVNYFNLKMAERRWDRAGSTEFSWCIQVFQGLENGATYAFENVALELVPQSPPAPGPMGVTKANLLRDASARWLGADSRVIGSAGSANAAAAAFNSLVWEITHENFASTDINVALSRMSLTTGALRANLTGEAAAIYGDMFASLGVGGWQTVSTEGWLSISAQDQFRIVPGPAALALLVFGGLLTRRRR